MRARTDFRSAGALLAALLALAAAGCATTAPGGAEAGAGGAASGGAKPAPAQPGQARPFAEVVKGASEAEGLFTTYRKEDKVWLAIRPDQFDRPYLLLVNNSTGIGEKRIMPGMMEREHLVYWRRVGERIQLVARNARFVAREGTPIARAVRQNFSDSLLASAAVAGAAHPQTGAVLVEASALFVTDIPSAASRLERAFRQSYVLDARNSAIEAVTGTPESTIVRVNAHFALPKLPVPPAPAEGRPAPPALRLPENLEDPRSLFLAFSYTLAAPPAEPMRPRRADPRVGYFQTTHYDYSDDHQPSPRVHYVNRWRLEKKDPAAALSEPVKPIVFWLDRNIPERYRASVTAGVLEWNKAFERIGFKDALRVEVQPADAPWDTTEGTRATIRWTIGTDGAFARGPSVVDPRSGEILGAAISFSEGMTRSARRYRTEVAPPLAAASWPEGRAAGCTYAEDMVEDMHFALDLLEARGAIEPGSPEAEAFVEASVKATIMHEVGHTLGLRHNFRASTAWDLAALSDPAFTRERGLSASVMDYIPTNLAHAGERQGEYHQSTLGPYDYWAVEYGYRPLEKDAERDALAAIAARGSEPALSYATDEDAGFGSGALAGIDPAVNRFDLGEDPLAWFDKRLALSRELWTRLQQREFSPGESYALLRRNFDAGLRAIGSAADLAVKFVGGVSYVRDGAGSGRLPLTPVPAQRQREALRLLVDGLFDTSSLRFRPEFMSRLVEDPLERGEDGHGESASASPDYGLAERVLSIQRGALWALLSDATAGRILNAEPKLANPQEAFRLAELHERLQDAIWSEATTGTDIGLMRRNLQREHLRWLVGTLTRPAGATPPDVVALARQNAGALRDRLARAAGGSAVSPEARAHLAEARAALDEALRAPLIRQGI